MKTKNTIALNKIIRDLKNPLYHKGLKEGFIEGQKSKLVNKIICKCGEEVTEFDFGSILVCKECHHWIWRFCKQYYWIKVKKK